MLTKVIEHDWMKGNATKSTSIKGTSKFLPSLNEDSVNKHASVGSRREAIFCCALPLIIAVAKSEHIGLIGVY